MSPLRPVLGGPFGIVERFAEPDAKADSPALLPVTLRNVEAQLKVNGLNTSGGKVADLRPERCRHHPLAAPGAALPRDQHQP